MYVDASKVQNLFNEQVVEQIFQKSIQGSFILQHATRLPNMSGKTYEMNILNSLPIAYWQNADIEHAKLSKLSLADKVIRAEKASVIILISNDTLADSKVDLAQIIVDRGAEAISALVDRAIVFGTNKPKGFRDGLVPSAYAVGAVITSTGRLYDDVSNAMEKVELSDYDPSAIVGGLGLKSKFRNLRDATGNPLSSDNEISSLPRYIVKNGSWEKSKADALVGDLAQIYYSIRQEIEVKVLDQATIKDPNVEGLEYNLAQQDMTAFRLDFRMGWEIPNPISIETVNMTNAFPFALIVPSTASAPNDQTTTITIQNANAVVIPNATVSVNGNKYISNELGKVVAKTFKSTDTIISVMADGYKSSDTFITTGSSATDTATITLEPFGTYTNPENKTETAYTAKSSKK